MNRYIKTAAIACGLIPWSFLVVGFTTANQIHSTKEVSVTMDDENATVALVDMDDDTGVTITVMK